MCWLCGVVYGGAVYSFTLFRGQKIFAVIVPVLPVGSEQEADWILVKVNQEMPTMTKKIQKHVRQDDPAGIVELSRKATLFLSKADACTFPFQLGTSSRARGEGEGEAICRQHREICLKSQLGRDASGRCGRKRIETPHSKHSLVT
jgi:hypothetical protein